MAQTQNKDKMLELTTEQIEKKFGKGAIMKLGSNAEHLEVAAIPTGALPLDAALGIGGVPRGRIVEIYGPESSGKTTVVFIAAITVRARSVHSVHNLAQPVLGFPGLTGIVI